MKKDELFGYVDSRIKEAAIRYREKEIVYIEDIKKEIDRILREISEEEKIDSKEYERIVEFCANDLIKNVHYVRNKEARESSYNLGGMYVNPNEKEVEKYKAEGVVRLDNEYLTRVRQIQEKLDKSGLPNAAKKKFQERIGEIVNEHLNDSKKMRNDVLEALCDVEQNILDEKSKDDFVKGLQDKTEGSPSENEKAFVTKEDLRSPEEKEAARKKLEDQFK